MSLNDFIEKEKKRLAPVRAIFGPIKRKSIPILEDCVNYPKEPLRELFFLGRQIESEGMVADTEEKIKKYDEIVERIKPLENPKPRIYLWEEGKMPQETEYLEYDRYDYNHAPDFKPYFFEMLIQEDQTPKGAVVLCAGGDHGDTILAEAYQTSLDLNQRGYQCFILLNRTNKNPWSGREAGVDAARLMRIVRKNAQKYRINANNIAFAGFSNGGLTGDAMIENYSGNQKVKDIFPAYIPDELDEIDATPNAFLCIYGARFVGESFDFNGVVYPPTFFAIGREDSCIDNFNAMYPTLLEHHVPVEIHTFAGVPHGQAGVSILDGYIKYPNFEMWLDLADQFMQDLFSK